MFKKLLKDAEEIAEFIIEFSSEPVDEELIKEYFWGCQGILKQISTNDLRQEDSHHHILNEQKLKEYRLLPIATMPPLIVENNYIKDGNHRFIVAKQKEQEKIYIYDIVPL